MKLTAKAIREKVLKAIEEERYPHYSVPMYNYLSDESGWPWKTLYSDGKVDVPGLGTLKVVDKYDEIATDQWGHTNSEESHFVVFTVGDSGQLFQKQGWRDSWDGYTHDDGPVLEVERYEKTVIAYREKQ